MGEANDKWTPSETGGFLFIMQKELTPDANAIFFPVAASKTPVWGGSSGKKAGQNSAGQLEWTRRVAL